MSISAISSYMMSVYVPSSGATNQAEQNDLEYQLILQELQAMGIASSGDKTTDKLKLETAKSYLEMLQSQSDSSSIKDRSSIPFDDVMNTLNLTITGDLDEDYDTTIDRLDYEIYLASSDEEEEYYQALKDLVESDYNTAKENRISYSSSYSQTSMLNQYLALMGL